MIKLVNLVLISFLFTISAFSQDAGTGKIKGKMMEANSTFEVIGGNIAIPGTTFGSVTDIDGTYEFEVPVGTYEVEFSYIGFATQRITDVVVAENDVVVLDIQMADEAIELEGATVVAKAFRNTEASVIALQKASPILLNGISSAQFKKSGDGDVASAVKRVTGVNLEGGKYVYVRGLGDRYSKTTLNKAEIPGLDPNKNTVQMDLFPTSLVDNIIVYKTFSPNLPGDFAGGLVEITTKDFPDAFKLGASVSMGYNPNVNLNSGFFTYDKSSTDILGFDDGLRAAPESVITFDGVLPDYTAGVNSESSAREVNRLTNSFENNWQMRQEAQPVNYGFSLNIGDQKTLFGNKLGLLASMTYSRSFTGYQNGLVGIQNLPGKVENYSTLVPQIELVDNQGQQETLWGALVNATYMIGADQKITLTGIHNQSGTSTARYAEGRKFSDDPDDIFQTRSWRYLQRGLSTVQLGGDHLISSEKKIKLDWLSSYSISTQDDPDLRFFTNRISDSGNVFIKPSSDNTPTRFYRNMQQSNWDTKVNVSIPFKQWNGGSSLFKAGLSYLTKDRAFREDRYNFNNNIFTVNTPEDMALADPFVDMKFYFEENNLATPGQGGYANNGEGVFISDNYSAKNNYDASQQVAAGYAMVEMPLTNSLRAITGVRAEQTNVQMKTFDTEATLTEYPFLDGKQDLLDNLDILPALTLNYSINDNQKVRMAYSRTIARPTFRELAPFASFNLDGGFIFVGNPDLQRTSINNIDLRWENYPDNGQNISFGLFAKQFADPIERTFNPTATNPELTYRNVDNAILAGAEFEFRKGLEFITEALSDFTFTGNVTYVYSKTDIDEQELRLIRAADPTAKDTRAMFGQAPYTVNTMISYKNDTGTNANLSFNMTGDRISVVTKGATPNYYIKAFPSLNFTFSQKLNELFSLNFSAQNILDAKYQEVATFKGNEYPIQVYNPGVSFSFGINYNLIK